MQTKLDTLKTIHKTIVSTQNLTANSTGLRLNEASVQAALIISLTTITTVILGFIFKDYWIPGWVEKRSKKIAGQELFCFYKNQLFNTTFSFSKRLHEIYRTRSQYLWTKTPMSSFYDYKYKSSVYRLCTVLGAIRAYRLSETVMAIDESNQKNIVKLIGHLESSLADGQGVEMSVAKSICEISKIDTNELTNDILEKFSIEIDHLVQEYQEEYLVDYIADLKEENINKFINDFCNLLKHLKFTGLLDDAQKKEIVKEVSIKLGLIYRDWQQAIGELMIVKDDKTYKVISFKVFEKMWSLKDNSEEKQWLNRAEKIFDGLDLKVDKKADSRIDQLKHIYSNSYNLLFQLFNIKVGVEPINKEVFYKLQKDLN
jgi:hypothetical protein